jgi:hypothetical protein
MLLKQFITFFMLVIFMAQTFSNAIVVADYYTNIASFSNHCENRDKPQMHCNGQCQMVKQMEKENNSGKPFSGASKEKNELQLFCSNDLQTEIYPPSITLITQNNSFTFSMQRCIRAFFHPPSVS